MSGEVENRLLWGKNPTHLVSEVLWCWKQFIEEHTYLCLEVRIRKAINEVSPQE